jgi:pyruvate,water dikinase
MCELPANVLLSICGQAPSDYPEFAEWLVQEGIDSISLSPDVAVRTPMTVAAAEAGMESPTRV